MDILSIFNLSFSFGVRSILEGVNITISGSDKCGLIGVNGSGKTTLFKLILDELIPDNGAIHISRGCSVGCFQQGGEFAEGETIGAAVRNIFMPLIDLEDKMADLEAKISRASGVAVSDASIDARGEGSDADDGGRSGGASSGGAGSGTGAGASSGGASSGNVSNVAAGSDADDGGRSGGVSSGGVSNVAAGSDADDGGRSGGVSSGGASASVEYLDSLIKKYDALTLSYEMAGGYEYRSRIRGVMKGLEIGGSDIGNDTPISTLSSGQKARLSLALTLINLPDILLLDEPTNHLDMDSLKWLEDYLRNYKKCFVVISHDRYFLDNVTSKIIEIENRSTVTYNGNYSFYLRKKAEDRELQMRRYENQQKEISRLESFIKQQRQWNRERNIIAAESRQKAIDRIDRIEKPKDIPRKINIRFQKAATGGNDVLYIDNVSKGFGNRLLFSGFSSVVKRNDRVFVIGPNGCGKSTLLSIIAGRLAPDSGCAELGYGIRLGYHDQEHIDLNDERSVLEEALNEDNGSAITDVRNLLASLLFYGDDVQKRIKLLSGGEKSRVALAKLILSGANLLLLDEPTNHLDIASREALENSLRAFSGTIITVSHDRYFIKNFATRIFYFDGAGVVDFMGGYEDYLSIAEENAAVATRIDSSLSDASREGVDWLGNNWLGENRTAVYQPDNIRLGTNEQGENRIGFDRQSGNMQSYYRQSEKPGKKESLNKLEYNRIKEVRSIQNRLATQLKRAEDQIEVIERRLSEIESEMADEKNISDHEKLIVLSGEQDELNVSLEHWLKQWEHLSNANLETIKDPQ